MDCLCVPEQGNLDIYRISINGGIPELLVGSSAREYHPTWLSDGKNIIYVQEKDGTSGLFVMDTTAKSSILLENLPAPVSWPAVSSDGRYLAFSAAPEGDWDLYLVELNSYWQPIPESLRRLTDSPGADISPAWNLQGMTIAFASYRHGSLDLMSLRLEDGVISTLTTTPAEEWAPQWLNDGRLIYQIYDGQTKSVMVYDPLVAISFQLPITGNSAAWPIPQP